MSGRIKHISRELKDYMETRLELLMLTASDKFSSLIGRSVQKLTGYSILFLGLVFALISLSIYIGDLLDNQALGYLIVSLPLVLMGLAVILSRPAFISKSVQNQLMQEVLDTLKEKERKSEQLSLPEEPTKEMNTDG